MTDQAPGPQPALAGKLQRIVARHIGGRGEILSLRRLTGGATKETWAFTSEIEGAQRAFILQLTRAAPAHAADDPRSGMPRVSGGDETAMMQAGMAAGVPTPPVRVVLGDDDGLGSGHITDFVEGETIARKILREPDYAPLRQRFAYQCGEAVGRLHAIDPKGLPFLVRFDAEPQVAKYKEIYRGYGAPIPALDVAFSWAEANLPRGGEPSVVHGDFRMGNIICGPDGIRAVLDWELACLGDPVADLGWLCTKTWRFGGPHPVGGVGSREDLIAGYEQASGRTVHRDHLAFWEAWGSVKWGVMCLLKGQAHRREAAERTVEAFAIGRRMEEPLYDFYDILTGRA
ncbi:phosphotransferase family protein [Chelatococcus reniformis]|uniref:Tyrosine protein kinase:aminoglycoside phosphotransferase n=1 Tax=Chelatococcus reniformis TaxID=1494448 RepID=A0A916U1Y7_9HYPH|nr:phosphotransferase family protein [Chelatococcus reniformis]GGC57055.1 tyrosine protein kinase:aminoglycoside phosphotransferase [Chelatococcus reniformis]